MVELIIAAVCVLIIMILFIVAGCNNVNVSERYLTGFWEASDDEFCDKSGIESMLFYIAEPIKGKRDCYLIIMDGLCNQALTLKKCGPGWGGFLSGRKYSATYDVKFDDEQIWPERINIEVDPIAGRMRIYGKDGQTFALLNKNHSMGSIANA